MDQREVVPRRDAIVGLSLLALFSLALVGTMAYRIVFPTTHVPPKVVINEWASQGPLPQDPSELFEPAADSPQLIAGELPAVDPIPTTVETSISVPAAATELAAPPVIETPMNGDMNAEAPATPPFFVAPSPR